MGRIAYCNGRYLDLAEPAFPLEERAAQFADGVYEVMKVLGGEIRDLPLHLDRLERSCGAIALVLPMSRRALVLVLHETLRRNALADALLYLQVSRGVAPRNHPFPPNVRPSLAVTVRRAMFPSRVELEEGIRVLTLPDERWARCGIKSIALLPNLLARQKAKAAGCREAWLVDREGRVTEGSSSNAWIVDADGRLVTRPLGPEILGGVTRAVLIALARGHGVEVVERAFTVAEAKAAREAMLSSTSSFLLPVTEIDGTVIGNGRPGSVWSRLQELYARHERLPARHWPEPSRAPARSCGKMFLAADGTAR
ncbi:MAG TPA: D-amino-acid transaminase [Geminicoccaceae bacterium]|nr:D-amino-acid transaminase [Geminicoccaceae bacterium]